MTGPRPALLVLVFASFVVAPLLAPAAVAYNVPPVGATKSFLTTDYERRVDSYAHTWIASKAVQLVVDDGRDLDDVLYNWASEPSRVYSGHDAASWIVAGAAFADSWGDSEVTEDSVNHFYTSTSDHQFGCTPALFGCSWRNSADYADELYDRAIRALRGTWVTWCRTTGGEDGWADVNDDEVRPATCDFAAENRREEEQVGVGPIEGWIGSSDPTGGCTYMVLAGTAFDAKAEMPCNSPANAFFLLGWSIHLVADSTVPFHVISDGECPAGYCALGSGGHQVYEAYVEKVLQGTISDGSAPYLPLNDETLRTTSECSPFEPDRLVWPPRQVDCDPVPYAVGGDPAASYRQRTWDSKRPGAWIRENAAVTTTMKPQVLAEANADPVSARFLECSERWNCWGAMLAFELDRAVKTSADVVDRFLRAGKTSGALDGTPPAIDVYGGFPIPPIRAVSGAGNWWIGSEPINLLTGEASGPMQPHVPLTIRIEDDMRVASHGISFGGVPGNCVKDDLTQSCSFIEEDKAVHYFTSLRKTGVYELEAQASAASGAASRTSRVFRVDFEDPTATANVPFTGDRVDSPFNLEITPSDGTGSGVASCLMRVSLKIASSTGDPDVKCRPGVTLTNGDYRVRYVVKDHAGRTLDASFDLGVGPGGRRVGGIDPVVTPPTDLLRIGNESTDGVPEALPAHGALLALGTLACAAVILARRGPRPPT